MFITKTIAISAINRKHSETYLLRKFNILTTLKLQVPERLFIIAQPVATNNIQLQRIDCFKVICIH